MAIAGFALFVMGLIFIIIAPINKRKNARCSAQTQGTMFDIQERYNSRGRLPSMYIYSYLVDGIEYQIKSTILSKEANEIGDSCTIWYNPKKPQNAQPFHYDSSKVYRIIFLIGIAMLVLGILLGMIGISQEVR